ncbi:MAG: transketolase family protein [Acidobacteriaceae bacterium]
MKTQAKIAKIASTPHFSEMRVGVGEGLMELGKTNPKVMVLTADLSESTKVSNFAKVYPKRFVEVGVAEQNMIGIAAGLAHEGKIPFCASFAVFSPGRTWEQIRLSVCYSKNNVKIIGSHAGISAGLDGATHQGLEDIALTRVLPNMKVLVPADALQAKKAIVLAAETEGPVYIRISRSALALFTPVEQVLEFGKAAILRSGKHATIAAAGPQLYYALQAAEELSKQKIECEVLDMVSIKPLDEATLIKSVKKTGCLVSAEEHQVAGGLGSAMAEVLSKNFPVPQEYVGMNDHFSESGKPEELSVKWGMDGFAILQAVKIAIKRKK